MTGWGAALDDPPAVAPAPADLPDSDAPPPDPGAPPHNLAAEAAVLGACLLSPSAVADAEAASLAPGHFYSPAHERIYRVIRDLASRGEPVDAVTVMQRLTDLDALARVGGPARLHSLIEGTPVAASVTHWARIIVALAVRRRLMAAGETILHDARTAHADDLDAALGRAQRLIDGVAHARPGDGDTVTLAESADALLDRADDDHDAAPPLAEGLLWGWRDLDAVCLPMTPGRLYVVGARPSIGKSAFVLNVARHVGIHQARHVLIHSIEMPADEVTERMVAAHAAIPVRNLIEARLTSRDWDRLARARAALADARVTISAARHVDIGAIRASIRRHRPDLVIIDHLQLLSFPGVRYADRRQALETACRDLKIMTEDEGLPILLAAQLNRDAERSRDRQPSMSDFRETGEVENTADLALLLHRPEFYDPTKRPGEVDVIVAKQRRGQTDTITLASQLHVARFSNLAI